MRLRKVVLGSIALISALATSATTVKAEPAHYVWENRVIIGATILEAGGKPCATIVAFSDHGQALRVKFVSNEKELFYSDYCTRLISESKTSRVKVNIITDEKYYYLLGTKGEIIPK